MLLYFYLNTAKLLYFLLLFFNRLIFYHIDKSLPLCYNLGMANNLSIMIKPASAKCNAGCKYCFYRDEVQARSVKDYGTFSNELACTLIDKVLDYVGSGYLSIVFQGGEPTLAGYNFFEHFFSYLKIKNVANAKVMLSLQTNGLLIDKKWARLFKEHNVLVGVSLDGDRKATTERVVKGEELFPMILESIRILREEKVDFNILSVIHKGNVKRGKQIYEDFKRRGFTNLQFIPYLGDNLDYVLDAKDYAEFLIDTYSLYARDFNTSPTRIRQFDNYLMLIKRGYAEQCGMNGRCEPTLVFEGDGTAFPCDFYCTDEYVLGNVKHQSIEELLYSEPAIKFRSTSGLKEKCKECPYLNICKGGCKRYATSDSFCEAYKIFFSHTFK